MVSCPMFLAVVSVDVTAVSSVSSSSTSTVVPSLSCSNLRTSRTVSKEGASNVVRLEAPGCCLRRLS